MKIFFLWRPFLRDPKDDMLLELAFVAGCEYIITFNTRDFDGVDQFGILAITPGRIRSANWREAMSTLSIRLPNPLHDRVRELVKRESISINQFVSTAVAEKLSAQ